MAESKDVSKQERKDVQTAQEPAITLLPAVDVFENNKGITLYADLPGVTGERLSLKVENDTLTIEGDIAFDVPENIQALYADVRSTRYRRSFALSRELNTDAIVANLKDGVLTVQLPKKEELQPRKITVQTS